MKIAIPELGAPHWNYYYALCRLGTEPVTVSEPSDFSDFSGLLLPGGPDINPSRYHEEINGSENICDELDELQFAVLDSFVRAGKPVFGICRGHQLISVYFGLHLIQDLPSRNIHAKTPGTAVDKRHLTHSVPGSFIHELYGNEFLTNSSHHQAAKEDGNGLKIAAVSEDGIIEAQYHKSLPVFSVQWHPERMCFNFASPALSDGRLVLEWFLSLCK